MLQEILAHTPIWVWFILLFLISRGIKASQDRYVSLKTILILPVLMLLWSLQGLLQHFGATIDVLMVWLSGIGLGLGAMMKFGNKNAVTFADDGQFHLRGSWIPMIFLVSLFLMKYAENVLVVMLPALKVDLRFVIVVSVVYGIMNGVFLANFVRAIVLLKKKKLNTVPETV